jgi:hypothetical protein
MEDLDRFDPSLFGAWEAGCSYRGALASPDEHPMDAAVADDIRLVLLEIKSATEPVSPAEELRRLLNEMTLEMRAQFATFRDLREGAGRALADGDEAAQKLARADVKAATDAMSLIVRTLEKVDSLQRQLARDRDAEAERSADQGGYEEAKARFIRMIEDRANERAAELYETWKSTGPPGFDGDLSSGAALEAAGCEGGKPADDPAED